MCAKQSGIKNAMHAEARLTGACLLPNHNSHVVIIQIYRKHREHCSGAAAADSSNVRLGCEHELQPVAVVPQVTVATHKVQLTAGQCSHSHKGATATLPEIPHRRHFFALLKFRTDSRSFQNHQLALGQCQPVHQPAGHCCHRLHQLAALHQRPWGFPETGPAFFPLMASLCQP